MNIKRFSIALLLLTAIACDKQEPANCDTLYLQAVSYSPTVVEQFDYTSGGTLTRSFTLDDRDTVRRSKLTRDNAGRLVTFQAKRNGGEETGTIFYAGSQVNYIIISKKNSPVLDSIKFTYNAGRPDRMYLYTSAGNGFREAKYYLQFAYTGQNITSIEKFEYEDGAFELTERKAYQYDDKINPFHNLYPAEFEAVMNQGISQSNNVTKITTTTFPDTYQMFTNYSYSYNNEGYPTNIRTANQVWDLIYTCNPQ